MIPEPPEGWQGDSACLGMDPASFYVDEPDSPGFRPERLHYGNLEWRDACYGCPVRAECLAHALLHGENFGVWGGLPPAARRHVHEFLAEGLVTWVQIAAKWQPAPLSQGRDTLAA